MQHTKIYEYEKFIRLESNDGYVNEKVYNPVFTQSCHMLIILLYECDLQFII